MREITADDLNFYSLFIETKLKLVKIIWREGASISILFSLKQHTRPIPAMRRGMKNFYSLFIETQDRDSGMGGDNSQISILFSLKQEFGYSSE